jgi:hypothetical protein
MSDVSKKYILNLCENNLSDYLKKFFLEIEAEISDKNIEEKVFDFILIDNESITLPVTKPVIFVGELVDRINFFKNNGVAVISNEFIKDSIEEVILKRLLGNNSSLNIEKAFDTKIDSNGSFKVTDHLNSGYYCDLLAAKAALSDFSYLNIRNSFFNLMNFISLVIDSDSGEFPVDVDFGISEEKFVIQTHFNVENFGAELLWSSFGDKENSFLKNSLDYCETIDCYILEKTGRLVLTLIIDKSESKMNNICIHNIKSFKLINIEELSGTSKVVSLGDIGEVKLASEKIQSISKVQNILEDDQVSQGHLVSITRVTKFIKNSGISTEGLSLENFDQIVSGYPNKNVLELLTVSDKNLIIESITNEVTCENLSHSLEEVEEVVGLDDFLESLVTKIDGLSPDEANEIISLEGDVTEISSTVVKGTADEEESSVTIKGSFEDQGEENEMVKGSREDLTEESQMIKGEREDLTEPTQMIKGSKEDLTEPTQMIKGDSTPEDTTKVVIKGESQNSTAGEMTRLDFSSAENKAQWSSAKLDIISEVRKRAAILKESGKSLKDLNQEVSEIVSNKLNMNSSESEVLSKGLFENASEKFVTDKNIGKGNGGNALRAKLENDKLKQDLDRRDSQLVRMKRLIDGMKRELVQKKELETDELKSSATELGPSSTASLDVINLNAELEKRDKQIELLKKNLDASNQNSEKLKNTLSDQNEPREVISNTDELELNNLKSEVKKLESQLQMAQARAESSNKRAENEKEMSSNRSANETKMFREKLAKSQEVISKFQKDNSDLSREVFELKKLKEDFENKANLLASNDHTEELKEKETQLTEVSKVSKQNEDRYRAANLRIKQLEQKNKFLTAQVSQASKKSSTSSGGSASAKMDPKASHKLKQLERVNEKLKASSGKFETELAAKKKEAHQFKLENNTLKLKIDELERKLSKLDKKAA